MNRKPSFMALMVLGVLTWASSGAMAAEGARPPEVGQKAPDFALKTPGVEQVELSKEPAERPVVLVVLRGWPGDTSARFARGR